MGKHYIAIHPNQSTTLCVWYVDDTSAYRPDGSGEHAEVPPGADPLDCVKATRQDWTFIEMAFAPGEYHPRMARASTSHPNDAPTAHPDNQQNKVLIETSRGQLVALQEQMERIFRTVHPTEKNFETYGHNIRNLLLLSATEVEAHWKGILKANGVDGTSTNDYIKLLSAMKLDEYAIALPFYPWLPPIKPFAGWSASAPTKSLRWYDAYNAVKHDRELHFERAKLIHAIEAVCACATIIFAQFGRNGFHDSGQLMRFFHLAEAPKWEHSDLYAVFPSTPRKPIPYPF